MSNKAEKHCSLRELASRYLVIFLILGSILGFVGCGGSESSTSPEVVPEPLPPPSPEPLPPPSPPPQASPPLFRPLPLCDIANQQWQQSVFCHSSDFRNRCAEPEKAFYKEITVQGTSVDENSWLRSVSHEIYFWYDEIIDRDPVCCTTAEYFELMRTERTNSSGEPVDMYHYSFPTEEYQSSLEGASIGYGAKFVFSGQKIVVAYTEPNSPAATAGLARGAQVLQINGEDVSMLDEETLKEKLDPSDSGTHMFTVQDPGSSQQRTVTMTSAQVNLQTVPSVKVLINSNSERVGYMLFNSYIPVAETSLINAVSSLTQGDGISDLVLDLRYNPGGRLSIVNMLVSMIAGSAYEGRTLTIVRQNDKIRPVPHSYVSYITNQDGEMVELPTLDLPRLFVLTTSGTCSGSEVTINSLRGLGIEVILIGSTTCGKYHGHIPADNCGTTYFITQLIVTNGNGDADYDDGFPPTCAVSDDFDYELGDPEENLLKTALAYQANGACPTSTESDDEGTSAESSEGVLPSANPVPTHSGLPGLILDRQVVE